VPIPTLQAYRSTLTSAKADVLAYFVFEDSDIFKRQIREIKRQFKDLSTPLSATTFSGKEQETQVLYPGHSASRKLLLVGLGKTEKLSLEKLRRGASAAAKSARHLKAPVLAIFEPAPQAVMKARPHFEENIWENIATALGEGSVLAAYKFDKYLTSSNGSKKTTRLKSVSVITEDTQRLKDISLGIAYAQLVCEGTYLARDLENAPGNEIFPESLARRAAEAGKKSRFQVTILNERKIKQLGMGGLLGVSQGSAKPPRFIIMEHNRSVKRKGTIVLVGKGVTFDSGGISIKPAAGMAEMKMDMSGAAAVIGTMQVAARMKLPVHLVGLIPATENLLGGAALKPGDILTHHNGKTSEVDNTDAEGRLILADALSYASKYKPDLVIDLATLTGACVVALGHYATGMMGTDEDTMKRLRESGERTYERVWQLPMFEEYEKLVKSDVADVKNVGGRWAGAITAAMFLKKFIGEYKWVHLDIAGTAIMEEAQDYIPKGGSGVGVRLLIDLLRHWKKA